MAWLLFVCFRRFINAVCDCALFDGQRPKLDQQEVAAPLEDYSVYASSAAQDNNKVSGNLCQNNVKYIAVLLSLLLITHTAAWCIIVVMSV